MLRGVIRALNHDDEYDDDDSGDDRNLLGRTEHYDMNGSELAWNLVLSILIIAGVLGYFIRLGVDKPLRIDGESDGFCPAMCAALGTLWREDTGCYGQGATSTFLCLLGFTLFWVWVGSGFQYKSCLFGVTCTSLSIAIRGIYPGCCGDSCVKNRRSGVCACTGISNNCSCTIATLVFCRVFTAIFGWICFTLNLITGCIIPWCSYFFFCHVLSCIPATICMFLARCFAYSVPLKLREEVPVINAQPVNESGANATFAWLPQATMAYTTPVNVQENGVGWGGRFIPDPTGSIQIGVVMTQPQPTAPAASDIKKGSNAVSPQNDRNGTDIIEANVVDSRVGDGSHGLAVAKEMELPTASKGTLRTMDM